MKHTEQSRIAASSFSGCQLNGLQFSSYAIGSCAYAWVNIASIDADSSGGSIWDPKKGEYIKVENPKTVYETIVEFVDHYRLPVIFALKDLEQPGKLNKAKLEAAHKEGKYKYLKFITETEGWHGTKSVCLFLAEIPNEASA
jgi:hypothetical protein